jgi:ribonucleoside-triphosphate reductase
MRDKIATYQEETGHLYNLEATPAESTTYRLAKVDRERYPGIITAGDETPYYTNSSHLPVDFDGDMFIALGHQEKLQAKYTGGTVFHTFLGERISDWKVTRNLVEKIATNYRIPYFTISPTYSICPDHGYITGEHYECPHCGKTAEVYSRITGYYRPVQHWNRGKKEEFKHRKEYDVSKGDTDEVRRMAKSESGGLSGENHNDSLYLRL